MIPDLPHLSNPTMPAAFKQPNNRDKSPLIDYARGGVALLDASHGLNVKNWVCEVSGKDVFISAPGVDHTRIEVLPGKIEWISMAFDQNMHYNLAYILENQGAFLYWYDATQNRYVTDSLGNIRTPILRMDDVRKYTDGDNDIILSYIRGRSLCVRVQRDRFGVEYVLANNAGSGLLQCGMNVGLRFQWSCA